MPGRGKRSRAEVVDLTGDIDAEQRARKNARLHTLASLPSMSTADDLLFPDESDEDDEDDGVNHVIDLAQEVDNNGIGFVQVGRINDSIVGVRYYVGQANAGEAVMIRREPSNQYDRNAIRVNNVQGTQIGHIPRRLAAKLAPYMDSKSLLVEGQLAGEKGYYECPITLKIYCTSEPTRRQEIEQQMKADGLPVIKQKSEPIPRKNTKGPQDRRNKLGLKGSGNGIGHKEEEISGPSLDELVQGSESFKPRDVQELIEQWSSPEDKLSDMPMAEQPKNLQAKLLPYQRQGLAWMLSMETPQLPGPGSKDVAQLWKCSPARSAHIYTNIATNFSTTSKPFLASGGILADDMGLGKTLQIISLIVEGGPGTTLIIAPVSVMSNWSQQMIRHIQTKHALRILTYHGSKRNDLMKSCDFQEYDVVITSYGTVSSEYSPNSRNCGLFSMDWRRVVLDEGHIIRNPATRAAVATSNLQARSRWVLSGTPIVNTIKDLYSMLKFLRITGGLEKMELFNAILARPLAAGDPQADILLQSIMRTMCLRRKKDMKFIDLKLPELSEYVHKIQFRPDELEKYKALQAEAKGMLHNYTTRVIQAPGSKPIDTYRHLLEILLRLRQVCSHWKLCESRITSLLSLLESTDVVELNPENKLALQALLQLSIESQDECPVCLDTLNSPVITACKHVFGLDCISRVIETQQKCPLCRAALTSVDKLVHPAPTTNPNTQDELNFDADTQSSKTEALMQIVTATLRHPQSKIVIFSQWTSLLSIVGAQLSLAGPAFGFTRLDGSMSAPARDRALSTFESSPSCRILLASLQVCSVGLNLVAADTVILMDSWWAPAIEDQAVDRVHRLGQTRPTKVWRLIMEDSVEERVLEVQKEKRALVGKAFREKEKRGAGRGERGITSRVTDIQRLLG